MSTMYPSSDALSAGLKQSKNSTRKTQTDTQIGSKLMMLDRAGRIQDNKKTQSASLHQFHSSKRLELQPKAEKLHPKFLRRLTWNFVFGSNQNGQ